jgi:hypothetical protein
MHLTRTGVGQDPGRRTAGGRDGAAQLIDVLDTWRTGVSKPAAGVCSPVQRD